MDRAPRLPDMEIGPLLGGLERGAPVVRRERSVIPADRCRHIACRRTCGAERLGDLANAAPELAELGFELTNPGALRRGAGVLEPAPHLECVQCQDEAARGRHTRVLVDRCARLLRVANAALQPPVRIAI